ncbi:hypothetical protein C7399_118124 [Paraburkholderia tropica]|uniref:Uncharacterized protein n=1 Tax=Paraburkholderia tropica TaxID=92647 RepID=A0ABX5MLX2_9BURK|nr:hypothetical protein C7400_117126 [Paraburkholderia tropica]PZW76499.1 hypothetical protein C7399_118124 [Paraburkholderia tropica]
MRWKGSDQGNVGVAKQAIVEDERGYNQSTGAPLRWGLQQYRHTEIQMCVILPENDLVRISFEYAKKY